MEIYEGILAQISQACLTEGDYDNHKIKYREIIRYYFYLQNKYYKYT